MFSVVGKALKTMPGIQFFDMIQARFYENIKMSHNFSFKVNFNTKLLNGIDDFFYEKKTVLI